jgi:hypothetical protein
LTLRSKRTFLKVGQEQNIIIYPLICQGRGIFTLISNITLQRLTTVGVLTLCRVPITFVPLEAHSTLSKGNSIVARVGRSFATAMAMNVFEADALLRASLQNILPCPLWAYLILCQESQICPLSLYPYTYTKFGLTSQILMVCFSCLVFEKEKTMILTFIERRLS